MKVTIVTGSFPEISETFIINHITSLIDEGHEVKVISFNQTRSKIRHQSYLAYNLERITYIERKKTNSRLNRYFNYVIDALTMLLTNSSAFFKLITNSQISNKHTYFSACKHTQLYNDSDIIHAHFGPTALRLAYLKEIGLIDEKIPLVCSFHGYDIDSPHFYLNKSFYKELFIHCNRIISNSNYLKKKLIQTGANANAIEVIKVGVDSNKFQPEVKTKRNFTSVVTVARLIEVKGLIYAIKAIELLVINGYQDIKYQIIGGGELYDSLNIYIKNQQLDNYIELLGPKSQEDILNYYKNADIFILPSIISSENRAEAQGLVIFEAQSMQLPVISTNIGGIPEGIIDGKTGFVVEQKSPEAIANKIELLIENPDKALKMGLAGREYVRENFDLKIIAKQTLSIYKELLNE